MTYVDLSHDIHENMPVFPGMSSPKLDKPFTVRTHGYTETLISFLSHTGTHIDSPAHMQVNGKTLDSYEINSFVGQAILVDVVGKMEISLKFLLSFEKLIETTDFVLFNTGWSKLWGKKEYYVGYPALNVDCAIWLANKGIKGIGLDCISADISESKDFPVHHALFGRNKLIVENLNNLGQLTVQTFMFSCLPIKYADSDGSPVRAVAWF
jgi:arylformamidase